MTLFFISTLLPDNVKRTVVALTDFAKCALNIWRYIICSFLKVVAMFFYLIAKYFSKLHLKSCYWCRRFGSTVGGKGTKSPFLLLEVLLPNFSPSKISSNKGTRVQLWKLSINYLDKWYYSRKKSLWRRKILLFFGKQSFRLLFIWIIAY